MLDLESSKKYSPLRIKIGLRFAIGVKFKKSLKFKEEVFVIN
jgi:hypothetical protein